MHTGELVPYGGYVTWPGQGAGEQAPVEGGIVGAQRATSMCWIGWRAGQGELLALLASAQYQALEVATELRPFPRDQADVVQYVSTLNEYLRPRVVSHHWYHDVGRSTPDTGNYYLVRGGAGPRALPLCPRPQDPQ